MRTLYDTPCNRVRVGRRTYKIKAPFDTVLFCLQALKSDDMSEADKIRLCVALLVVHPPRSMTEKEKVLKMQTAKEVFAWIKAHEDQADEEICTYFNRLMRDEFASRIKDYDPEVNYDIGFKRR